MGTVKRLVIFDLDGTLAASKHSIDEAMALLIAKLLEMTMPSGRRSPG